MLEAGLQYVSHSSKKERVLPTLPTWVWQGITDIITESLLINDDMPTYVHAYIVFATPTESM